MTGRIRFALAITLVLTFIVLSSCINVLGFLDNPSGDNQLTSAGDGCLDRSSFSCAITNYSSISTNNEDIRASRTAFALIAQYGSTMGQFIESFGTGGGTGPGLNALAADILPYASQATRLQIYSAYLEYLQISNTQLKNLVRFVTATSLAAEILAEASNSSTGIAKTNFAQNPTACVAGVCGALSACDPPTTTPGSNLTSIITTTFNLDTTSPSNTLPDTAYLQAAFFEADTALQNLNASGSFGATSSTLGLLTNAAFLLNNAECMRQALLEQGVGN